MKKSLLSATFLVLTILVSAQNFQSALSHGGTFNDVMAGISTDANGNSYITGAFYSPTLKFGTTTLTRSGTSTSFADLFIAKYDPSGNVLWAKSIGGTGEEQGTGISLDANGNCYVSGFFNSASIT